MRSLSVRVLGEFEVDGLEQSALGSRKGRALLRLLALARGRAVSGDVLAMALWSDAPPARPADQVAVLISRLRAVLGRDRLEHTDFGYRLRYDWLDVDELAALVGEIERRQQEGNVRGANAAARVALSLIRGEPAIEEHPWALARVTEIDRLTMRARCVAARAMTTGGSWLEAVDVASDAVQHDPYDEEALRLLMRAYVAGGRVASALSAYAAARERLADELGADPSPETAALHAAILRGEVVVRSLPPSGPAAPLVGRRVELDRLDEVVARARSGSPAVVVIEGEAGIGKTSFIRAWAAHRAGIGEIVLSATCGALDRAVPLDGLLAAVGAHLRVAGPDFSADVLGADHQLLASLLSLDGEATPAPALADGVVEPVVLFAAVLRLLQRLSRHAPLVVILDDAHLAGPILAQWLEFVRRRASGLVIVAGVRSGAGTPLPGDERIMLGPLDRASSAILVGEDRVEALYGLSAGHPLFLTELAAAAGPGQLPASLVEAVSTSCADLGASTAQTLRTAAIIGARLDLDLLAAVARRPVIDVLEEVERAVAGRLLVDDEGTFWFRHELVRAALEASASLARRSLVHREAGRVLRLRPDADPVEVADHARRGGDIELAARSLRAAAARASQRFDHETAEELLDDALALNGNAEGWLQRARTRTLRGRYGAAYEDVERAAPAGAPALEVGAWASYFDRRFERAAQFARDGALAADEPGVRARCLTVGGRTQHAAGDLDAAQRLLGEAVDLATGTDQVTASAWLGVVRAHQSRIEDALRLLSPAARAHIGVEHTSAALHALLFTGHAHASAGRSAAALNLFARYTDEVGRRHVPRFEGRGVNFAGWVLRNLGAVDEGVDRHLEALDVGGTLGTAELTIAALEDLAEERLAAGDLDCAAARLDTAESLLVGDLVFGWRLDMKLRLLRGRLSLANEHPETALAVLTALAVRAASIGVPRYASVARLLGHRARAAMGQPIDLVAVESDLDVVDRCMAIEAWWWTGETAAALRVPQWIERAAAAAARLAAEAGDHRGQLEAAAAGRLDRWRAAAG